MWLDYNEGFSDTFRPVLVGVLHVFDAVRLMLQLLKCLKTKKASAV